MVYSTPNKVKKTYTFNTTGRKKKNFGHARGDGVNKVYVHRTPLAIPQGSGVGCNTTSPFGGSRHYISNY